MVHILYTYVRTCVYALYVLIHTYMCSTCILALGGTILLISGCSVLGWQSSSPNYQLSFFLGRKCWAWVTTCVPMQVLQYPLRNERARSKLFQWRSHYYKHDQAWPFQVNLVIMYLPASWTPAGGRAPPIDGWWAPTTAGCNYVLSSIYMYTFYSPVNTFSKVVFPARYILFKQGAYEFIPQRSAWKTLLATHSSFQTTSCWEIPYWSKVLLYKQRITAHSVIAFYHAQ